MMKNIRYFVAQTPETQNLSFNIPLNSLKLAALRGFGTTPYNGFFETKSLQLPKFPLIINGVNKEQVCKTLGLSETRHRKAFVMVIAGSFGLMDSMLLCTE